ncbi:holo-[acyl-carrier-protein] synthase [Marinococcus halophilus]|uniref:Holo-[acyl-carrier-protein] synthase n=1 Tax=Marinococcus halophilus TaxID=1371 RepID=A0A510Y2R9_MARHA|nr:holo-ACP synthase [Marinococcus halophilus]OZT81541.1 holo-[acyl-carrier-protein] synthase [Marinococcus halophilus]GEK57483.1 holo-[acyl-carrier-protein] synthase [Marinococcus halophilus]
MIKGIGIDIIELERIERSLKQKKFLPRILNEQELIASERLSGKRLVAFTAGRFAAKEAFVKAAGTGISAETGFHDITVSNGKKGEPLLRCRGYEAYTIHVSISHSRDSAVAQVIIEERSEGYADRNE